VARRVSEALHGYAPATGAQDQWPLTDRHLYQLREAEQHRKPIRNCASLLGALAALYLILGAAVAVSMLASASGPNAAYAAGSALGFGGVMIGLSILAAFARAATIRCRPWGAITFAGLFCVGIVINLGSCAVQLAADGPRGPEIVGNLISLALAVLFTYICIRAVQAIPRFLACPVWAQEALVSSGL
jgi:amino acid transporter